MNSLPSGFLRANAPRIAGFAFAWILVIGVLIGLLAQSQARSREDLNQRFEARAVMASRFVSTYVSDLIVRQRDLARRRLADERVDQRGFEEVAADSGYGAALLLDDQGRVLRSVPFKPGLIGSRLSQKYPHLAAGVRGRVGVSPVVPSAARGIPVVAFAVPFDTPSGRRVYSGGYDISLTPLGAYLQNAIPIAGTRLYLVDSAGQVVAKNGARTPRPERFSRIEGGLAEATKGGGTGTYESPAGLRRFSARAVTGTPWRIVVTVSEARLQTSLDGAGRWLPWLAVLGFAMAGLAVGFLLLRLLASRAGLLASRAELAAAVARLREREQMLNGVVDNSSTLIYVKHLDGRYLLYNQRFTDAFNLDARGEAEGKSGREVLLGRDDTWLDPELAPTWRANDVLATQGPQLIEEWSDHPSRGRLTYDSIKFPLTDGEGCLYATCGISLDVTDRLRVTQELRDAEERFRGAFENAPIGMGLADLDGRWSRVNQAFCDFTGYTREELLTKTLKDITHPDEHESDEHDQLGLETGATSGYQREKRYLHADGRTIWGLVSVSLVRDSDGEPLHLIGQVQDVTVRKRAQSDLAIARDQAIEASRVKSEFLATMSHELRTPLNGVIGMTELLLSTALTPEQTEFARTAATSGEALLGVINDVLDFSKIEAGKLELEVHEFNPRESVEDTCEMLAGHAHGKGLELTVWIDDDLPDIVAGDRGRLRQVLTNLVANAVKFTEAGEVNLRVRASLRPDESVLLCFEVTDTGIGIAEEEIGRLFESFSQADSSMTRRFGGTGLGLAISRRLVELMGGEISAVSSPGVGSTFRFTVCLDIPVRPRAARPSHIAAPDPLRVLVVDSHATSRTVLEAYLNSRSLKCSQAGSVGEAVAALKAASHPFDVILAGVALAGSSGIELARTIRSTPSACRTPVILLIRTQDERQAARAAGCSHLLNKPVRRAQLFEALANAVAGVTRDRSDVYEPAKPTAIVSASPSLLVVEDNAVNQLVIKTMLIKRGFTVEIATNGLEALDAHDARDFAAVLMDCQMPKLDGYGATAAIRAREEEDEHLVIIAMTANALKGDRQRCLESGMDDYLAKPLRPEQLDEVLERWLGDRSVEPVSPVAALPEAPIEALVDDARMQILREQYGEVTEQLVELFEQGTPPLLAELRTAGEQADAEGLKGAAHQLKGSCQSIGASFMATLAKDLEHGGDCAGGVDRLEAAFGPTNAAIRLALFPRAG